ncbi:DUF421 domain-containing protein [Sabulicella rubraurantiaca]|uniref:DUF421 domain-containing protein n=1 Tax=Sabulicella rubraurantiaca TaxID=2811429 RepID=UPI001A976F57|nr:YetF domain-containing protein [Sabulicella rubraurantiaca]
MPDWIWPLVLSLQETADWLLGLERDIKDVSSGQMALRAILIYGLALVLIRVASKRFLSQATAFDVIVAIMLGSILSRAINGSAPFLPTVLAAAALVALHWVLASLAVHTSIGTIFKGEPQLLIKDGEVQEEAMRRARITSADLDQALRINAKHTDRSKIRRAYLERNGSISVIPYPSGFRSWTCRSRTGSRASASRLSDPCIQSPVSQWTF